MPCRCALLLVVVFLVFIVIYDYLLFYCLSCAVQVFVWRCENNNKNNNKNYNNKNNVCRLGILCACERVCV